MTIATRIGRYPWGDAAGAGAAPIITGTMLAFVRRSVWPRIPTLRIRSVTRIGLDRVLDRQFERLTPGSVLDIGAKASPYRHLIPATRYTRLDIEPASEPDICCDIHELECAPGSFDTVVAIEVLEHLYDPQRALDRIWHALGTGGVCIASTRFFYRYHPDPKDYYRFTWDSLEHLFRRFGHVEVHHHGNRLQSLWEIVNPGGRSRVVLNLLNPLVARMESDRTRFPLGFVVYARK